MLKGIDISHYQGDAGLTNLASLPNIQFVIVKATEGLTYVDPWCDKYVQQAIKLDLPWGFYHFGRSNNPETEAIWFYNNCKNYFNWGIPVLDWEDNQSVSWVNKFVRKLHDLTGVWCWIYANPWRFNQGGVEPNCGRWVAKYPNVKHPDLNYDPGSIPKTDGLVCCWQYASDGRIKGYSGNLDLNHFYGDKSAWLAYAKFSTNNQPNVENISTLENDKYIITIKEK